MLKGVKHGSQFLTWGHTGQHVCRKVEKFGKSTPLLYEKYETLTSLLSRALLRQKNFY